MTSPRKVKSALSLIPEEGSVRMAASTPAKSCESLYSNNTASSRGSATVLYRKAATMVAGQRQASLIPATSDIRQRVLSARRLRVKTYQNQLADAQQTISDLAQENRILRTLHKRQDSALAKYESTNAELPQLLHSHAEEIRVWQAKYRNLQAINKELEQKLKQKDSVILSVTDQNKYYHQLNKDKSLEERQRLTDKLHRLETRLQEKDKEIKLISRKFLIEGKSLKKQIENEQKKYKDLIVKLEKTRLELSSYRKLDEISFSDKLPNDVIRRKGPEIKREKSLEPPLDESDFSANNVLDEPDAYLLNSRLIKDDSKLEFRSNRGINIKKVGPTLVMADTPKMSAPPALKRPQRRIDRGDGDASALSEMNYRHQSKLTATAEPTPTDKQYIDVSTHGNNAEEEDKTMKAEVMVHGDDDDDDDDDVDNDNVDDVEELDNNNDEGNTDVDADLSTNRTNISSTPNDSARMKKDISKIRKQITADFKEREAFLDTFCRQAATPTDKPSKRIDNINKNRNIPNNRKHKLLAALKAIDNNQSIDK